MKTKFLLLGLLLPLLGYSQQYEIGIGVGASINSKPTNNMLFRGDVVAANYATDFTFLKNINTDWQIGFDLHVLELSRRSTITYNNAGTDIGNDNKKFVYAKYAFAICAVANRKFHVDNNYFYVGAAMGAAIARNNSTETRSDASYLAPDGGYGLCIGLQAGYTYNFSTRWALNFEVAARYYDLDYDAHAPVIKPYTNIHYRIVAYPVTFGIRYRFGYQKKLNTMGETEIVH